MTTPTDRDYPDYARRVARVDEILIDATVGRGASITQTAIFPMAGVPGVLYQVSPVIGHMRVTATWFIDRLGANLLASQTIHVRNGTDINQSLPALGPFMRLSFTDTTVNDTALLKAATTGFIGPSEVDHNRRRLNSGDLVSIAAGATSTSTSFLVLVGIASLQFLSEAATFTVVVSSVNFDNTTSVMYRFDEGGGRSQSHLISVPAQPTRIAVTNNSAAAADFSWFLHFVDPALGSRG